MRFREGMMQDIKVKDLVRATKGSKLFKVGQEGEVLSVYTTESGLGGVDVRYKVKFVDGPICVVGLSDIEGAMGLGATL